MLWLATAANKWFIWEDDLGSIEIGNHADLAVLDRDCFTVSEDDLKRTRSLLTIVGGRVVHNDGVV
jgi:predicted amidohydrolase YtcJ